MKNTCTGMCRVIGGPVPATGRTTHSHYVYVVKVKGGKVAAMTKIWNSGFALRELGWS